MSDLVIITIITSGVSFGGVLTGFIATILYNKKRFEKLANNEMKHLELDPHGETMQAIKGLQKCFGELKHEMSDLRQQVTGLKQQVTVSCITMPN